MSVMIVLSLQTVSSEARDRKRQSPNKTSAGEVMVMALNTRQEFFDRLVAVLSSAAGPVKELIMIKKCMPCCLIEMTGWSIDLD